MENPINSQGSTIDFLTITEGMSFYANYGTH